MDDIAETIKDLSKVRTRNLVLPPPLRQIYLSDTWQARRKIIQSFCGAVIFVNVLCMVFDPYIVGPEALQTVIVARLATCLVFLGAIAFLQRMPHEGAEGVVVVASCAALVVIAGVAGLLAGPALMERSVVHAIFMCGSGVMVCRIAWRDTLILAGVAIALPAIFFATPEVGLSAAEKAQSIFFYGAGVASLALARLAQNRLHHRVFVLTMSERIKMREIEEMNGRLFNMARTDPLTGLSNRRHFDEVFGALRLGTDGRASVALFMIDIDNFKRLNDALGHAAGDDRLKAVAGLIKAELRHGEPFLARYGGEEFVALLPDVGRDEALAIAERVRAAVEARGLPNPSGIDGGVVTVSVGVAMAPPSGLHSLVSDADAALYQAKTLGRNRVEASARVGPPPRPETPADERFGPCHADHAAKPA